MQKIYLFATADLPAEVVEAVKNRIKDPISWKEATHLLAKLKHLG